MRDFVETAFKYFWRLFVLGVVLFLIISYVFLLSPPTYTARTLILYKLGYEYGYVPDQTEVGLKSLNPGDFQTAVNAEMLMLNSPKVDEAALEAVGLDRVFQGAEEMPDMDTAVRWLGASKAINLITGSYVVELAVSHVNPHIASELANAIVASYLNARQRVFAESDSSALRQRLETANMQSKQISQKISFLIGSTDTAIYAADFQSLINARELLRNQMLDSETELSGLLKRQASLEDSLMNVEEVEEESSDFQRNPVIRDFERRIAEQRAELQAREGKFGARHQSVIELRDEVDSLTQQLAEQDVEVPTLRRRGINPVWRGLKGKLIETEVGIKELQARIAYLKTETEANEQEISMRSDTMTELKSLQLNLDLQTRRIASLQSRLRESEGFEGVDGQFQSSARVIEQAVPPYAPSGASPQLRLVIAAIIAAAITGMVLVMTHLLRRRIISAETVEDKLGLPVLGEVAARSRRQMRSVSA